MKGQIFKPLVFAIVACIAGFGAGVMFRRTRATSVEIPPIKATLPETSARSGSPKETAERPGQPQEQDKNEKAEIPSDATGEQKPESAGDRQAQPREGEGAAPEQKVSFPEGEQAFRWDFSKKHVYVYDLEQKAKTTVSRRVQEQLGRGNLSVESKGDGTATMIVSDVVLESRPDMKVPPTVMDGLAEDSGLPEDASGEVTLRFLFPLPQEGVEVGESVSIPARMPVNADGNILWAQGRIDITLKEYVEVDAVACAKFDMEMNITKLDVPEDLPGNYECSLTGRGVVLFNIGERCFQSGDLSVTLRMVVEGKPGTLFANKRISSVIESTAKYNRNRDKEKKANEE